MRENEPDWKERDGIKAYFGLFKGEEHTLSEMSVLVKPALESLVSGGHAIQQLALDGDDLIVGIKKI